MFLPWKLLNPPCVLSYATKGVLSPWENTKIFEVLTFGWSLTQGSILLITVCVNRLGNDFVPPLFFSLTLLVTVAPVLEDCSWKVARQSQADKVNLVFLFIFLCLRKTARIRHHLTFIFHSEHRKYQISFRLVKKLSRKVAFVSVVTFKDLTRLNN